MILDLDVFFNRVNYYLYMEYGEKYSKKLHRGLGDVIKIIKAYYWGGNSIPDTARAVVDYVNHENSL